MVWIMSKMDVHYSSSYNSLENPIGIETNRSRTMRKWGTALQLIRKPDRDWNIHLMVAGDYLPVRVTTH